jgi:hypothetical protein
VQSVSKSCLPVLGILSLALLSVLRESRAGQSSPKTAVGTGPTEFVDTFVGTAGPDMGDTYPAAKLPLWSDLSQIPLPRP